MNVKLSNARGAAGVSVDSTTETYCGIRSHLGKSQRLIEVICEEVSKKTVESDAVLWDSSGISWGNSDGVLRCRRVDTVGLQ